MDSDKILRIYTRLRALKEHLPGSSQLHQKYVDEYHSLIKELSDATGEELDEFSIATQEIKPKLVAVGIAGGVKHYSKDAYCERALLLMKMDALLSYFNIKYLSKEERKIGFRLSQE